MTKVYLVAGLHGDRAEQDTLPLLSKTCRGRFQAKVAPLVTDDSILFCEGANTEGPLRSARRTYAHFENHFHFPLNGKRPAYCGFDFRQHPDARINAMMLAAYDAWEQLVPQIFVGDFTRTADSLEEAIELLRGKHPEVMLARSPTSQEVELARWVSAKCLKFDRLYLEGMEKHGPRFDSCFFIGGATHVASLALKRDYSVISLLPEGWGTKIYYSYLAIYRWARLLHAKS